MQEPKTIITKIKYIKKCLKKPYHTINYTDKGLCVFTIEDKDGNLLKWTGSRINSAINDAMNYIRHEIEMGAIKEPKK